jgi:hypothetical protein
MFALKNDLRAHLGVCLCVYSYHNNIHMYTYTYSKQPSGKIRGTEMWKKGDPKPDIHDLSGFRSYIHIFIYI